MEMDRVDKLVSSELMPEVIKNVKLDRIPDDLVRYVKPALEEFKLEVASELGIDYGIVDKGNLSSRDNGKVGGMMVRKMVLFSESVLAWRYRERVRGGK